MKTLTPFIFYQIGSPCLEHDRNNAGYFIFSTGNVFGNWEVTVPESYGRSSPHRTDEGISYVVYSYGGIGNGHYNVNWDSYGRFALYEFK